MKSYFENREISCIKKINHLLTELPYYVEDFFIGVANTTSPLSRLNYAYDLRIFFDFLSKKVFRGKKVLDITLKDLDILESNDIEFFINYLSLYSLDGKQKRCTETGKARKLSTLRAFFKYFFNKNILKANVATKVLMPKIHEKEIIRLDVNEKVNEIDDILSATQYGNGLTKRQLAYHNTTKERDVAIITLFLGTGIRISELVGLNVEDFDFNSNSFIVTRKGGNRTVLYFNEQVSSALQEYLAIRRENKLIDKDEKAFFISLQNKRISTRTIQDLVKKYAHLSTPLKKITPHKLRSTFGTNLYRQTGDIYVVADCLGHKDVNTTRKHYAAISDDIRKKAAINLNITNKENN